MSLAPIEVEDLEKVPGQQEGEECMANDIHPVYSADVSNIGAQHRHHNTKDRWWDIVLDVTGDMNISWKSASYRRSPYAMAIN